MIPCRVAIYQTSTGKVVISRMNSEMFAGMMDGVVAEVVKTLGTDYGSHYCQDSDKTETELNLITHSDMKVNDVYHNPGLLLLRAPGCD